MVYGNNSYRYILYIINIFTDSTGLDIIYENDIMSCTHSRKI